MAYMPFMLPFPIMGSRHPSIQYVHYRQPYMAYGRRYYNHQYGQYNSYYQNNKSPVMLGPLPDDFLVVPSSADPGMQRLQQEEIDHAIAEQLQRSTRTQPVVGRLQITVVRATLHKNYGMTRMDPYTRLHFGQQVFETPTDPNGAKNPVWNKTFYIYQLPKSFTSFHLELYDERTLTDDERIAWLTVSLPHDLQQGEVCDKWYTLSGRLGDQLEGSIHIIMAYHSGPMQPAPPMVVYGGVGYPTGAHFASSLPVYQQQQQQMPYQQQQQMPYQQQQQMPYQQQQQMPLPPQQIPVQQQQLPPPLSEDEIKEVCAMFPEVEKEVVLSVLEGCNNNTDAAVEALLTMQ